MTSSLELALCRLHQRNHCVLVSSATVGMTLTLEALNLSGRGVAIPSSVCLNVPLAIKYAGAKPVYCDIEPDTLGLSVETLTASGQQFSAVVAVHAYGNVCDIDALADYCRSAAIPLIEDVAVAQGATVNGRPAGSFGVASILSFGRGKTIDVGGGGAVLTDDAGLAKYVHEQYRKLPVRSDADEHRLDEFSTRHTRLYNEHYGAGLREHIPLFIDTALSLRGPTLTQSEWNQEALLGGLGSLPANMSRRHALTEAFFTQVERLPAAILCHRPAQESIPWRACISIPAYRDQLLRALLSDRIKVSSWYPPAQEFLELSSSSETPVAKRLGDEILNVWVNDEVDVGYLQHVAERIADFFKSVAKV